MVSKIITTTLGIIFFKFSFCQITTTKVVINEVPKNVVVYDSTLNFLGEDPSPYKGQELYLKGMRESIRYYGYDGFVIDYKKDPRSLKNTYKPIIPENKEYIKYDIGGGRSIYDSLVGKYFKVLDVYKHPKDDEQERYRYLVLEEKDSGDTLFFEYDGRYEGEFPFLVVGHFEKLKRNLIGQSYVIGTKYYNIDSKDISGNIIHNKQGQKWTCIDLTIDESNYDISLVLQNSLGEKIMVSYKDHFDSQEFVWFCPWKKAETYKIKFGVVNWNVILNRDINIGFTEEMVILAWGKPESINRASYGDQWVYHNQYLYFKNGKLTDFN